MELNLRGEVALVQGASAGIGRGIAESLAAEGADLIITGRTAETLDAAADAIMKAHSVKVVPVIADSGSLADMERLAGVVESEFGRLDALVCNSGGPVAGGFEELTAEQWVRGAELLIVAPAFLLRRVLPLMKESRAPRFFVVTSTSTRYSIPGLTLSNVYRPGIVGMIKTLAEELAPRGICCHSIAPGRFDTNRLAGLISRMADCQGISTADVRTQIVATIPAGRLGDPSDIGSLVAFLASEKADYLTGQNWLVDGGLVRSH